MSWGSGNVTGLVEQTEVAVAETVGVETGTGQAGWDDPVTRFDAQDETTGEPVMPAAPPFPAFEHTPTLPHQSPGNGYESGRDSRAR